MYPALLNICGVVLTCRSNTYDRKHPKQGESKTFTMHRCLIHNPVSDREPIRVDTGEHALLKDKYYIIPVYASLYTPENGSPMIQFRALKNEPPQMIEPPALPR